MAKLPKAPKRPKASASLATWEKFDQRVKDYDKKVREIKSNASKKANLIKKTTAAIGAVKR